MINKNITLVSQKRQDSDFTEQDLSNAPDGFFTEIKVLDVLEMSQDAQILDKICSKVRKQGKVIVSGIDGLEMCRKVYYGQMPLNDAAQNFFKHINNLNSIPSLKKYFLEKKWDVAFVGLSDGRYLLEAVRV